VPVLIVVLEPLFGLRSSVCGAWESPLFTGGAIHWRAFDPG